jgi:putative transposase
VELLRQAFRKVRSNRPFVLEAMVVLPDHLHCIWTLPTDDIDFMTRWRLIKTWFTKHAKPAAQCTVTRSRFNSGEYRVWQPRYWEHQLRDETDLSHHLDYIHFNPVKHGHVLSPSEWPYSSFGKFVRLGHYPADWGGPVREIVGVGSE